MTNNLKSNGKLKAQEVEPVKNLKDIAKIKQYLLGKQSKRDYMLFVVGINVGLRAGDLLSLKIKDVMDANKFKEAIQIHEEKTDKSKVFEINKSAQEAINLYLGSLKDYTPYDYLFASQKGEALTVESAHKIIKTTLRDLDVKGNYGTHTLRKTFAYHTYVNNIQHDPTIMETLQKILNHSSASTTLKYIGITKEVVASVYTSLNL